MSASDIDLMIVGDVDFTAIARILAEPQRRLGREVNPSVYTPAEFEKRVREGHHFLSSVMAGEKIFLIGDEHELSRMVEERVDSLQSFRAKRGAGVYETTGLASEGEIEQLRLLAHSLSERVLK